MVRTWESPDRTRTEQPDPSSAQKSEKSLSIFFVNRSTDLHCVCPLQLFFSSLWSPPPFSLDSLLKFLPVSSCFFFSFNFYCHWDNSLASSINQVGRSTLNNFLGIKAMAAVSAFLYGFPHLFCHRGPTVCQTGHWRKRFENLKGSRAYKETDMPTQSPTDSKYGCRRWSKTGKLTPEMWVISASEKRVRMVSKN